MVLPLSPYSGTENLVKCLFCAAERTNRTNQIRDGSNKDNETSSLLFPLKMFWRKKGQGIPEQKLYLLVPVMFMRPLVACFSNPCFNPYTEGSLNKDIFSVHTEFEYLMELRCIVLVHCTFHPSIVDSFLLNWSIIRRMFSRFLEPVGISLALWHIKPTLLCHRCMVRFGSQKCKD